MGLNERQVEEAGSREGRTSEREREICWSHSLSRWFPLLLIEPHQPCTRSLTLLKHSFETRKRDIKLASESKREHQRISMRIDLEVLNSIDHIITTSTSDSECVSVRDGSLCSPVVSPLAASQGE